MLCVLEDLLFHLFTMLVLVYGIIILRVIHIDKDPIHGQILGNIVIFGIWDAKQISTFSKINNGVTFLCLAILFTGFINIFDITAIDLVNDVGDSSAIYRSDSILAAILSFSIQSTRNDWKHRYWLCVILVIIGVVLISSPSFDTKTFNVSQFIGYLCAFLAALSGALDNIFSTLYKKSQKEYIASEMERIIVNVDNINEELGLLDQQNDGNINTIAKATDDNDDLKSLQSNNQALDNYNQIAVNDKKISVIFMYGGSLSVGLVCITIWLVTYGIEQLRFDLFSLDGVDEIIWLELVGVVILRYISSYLTNIAFLKINDATLSSILSAISVVFTYVAAYCFLSQVPTYLSIVGGVIVSFSVAIAVSPIECKCIPKF